MLGNHPVQGPFDASKGNVAVPFRNVFPREADFVYASSNPAFSVKAGERLAARKSVSIAVGFKADPARPRTGKLTVTCPKESQAQWVFYLQA